MKTGLIRFDDDIIVEFVLDTENQKISLKIVDPTDTYFISERDYTGGE